MAGSDTKRREPSGVKRPKGELGRPLMKRLVSYHQIASQTAERGVTHVPSSYMANLLGIDDSLVRKDMAIAEVSGRPKVGYDVAEMLSRLESLLGLGSRNDAILIGCGHLGTAILGYPGFSGYGLRITAAFDTDASKVGREIAGHQVLAMEKAPGIIELFRIEIAILTVPGAAAQELADFLIGHGIKGIWNFAPVLLRVPSEVMVRNENLALGLARLIHSLKEERVREGVVEK